LAWSRKLSVIRRWLRAKRAAYEGLIWAGQPGAETFLLQGGDCASFSSSALTASATPLSTCRWRWFLTYSAKGAAMVKLGPDGGPEMANHVPPRPGCGRHKELPSYRSDIVLGSEFHSRIPHPRSGADGTGVSAGSGLAEPAARIRGGGYADVHKVHAWTLGTDKPEAKSTAIWPTGSAIPSTS
jgi:3-deoxy-7-phosphoheptulonate synthase